MPAGSRKMLWKLSFVVAALTFLLSFQPLTAAGGFGVGGCSQSCYQPVHDQAIACFQRSWANGGNGEECCFYNNRARFCGSGCPLFCAEP